MSSVLINGGIWAQTRARGEHHAKGEVMSLQAKKLPEVWGEAWIDLTIKYTQAGKTASNVGPSERSLALYFAINIHGAEIASEDKELG